MEVTFWGVRGSVPTPGPGTVRYGGNTSCVSVRTGDGSLLVLDCGTGARNLGLALMADDADDRFRMGRGRAAVFLSHTHWDHIQGLPFFGPLYVEGNAFEIRGPAESSGRLQELLEAQMAPQYFPVQTLANMGARIDVAALTGAPIEVLGCRITAATNRHGGRGALAFRIDDGQRTLVYASDTGYASGVLSAEALALYAGADLLIHDSTHADRDGAAPSLGSVSEAVAIALRAGARRLALFHYNPEYTDADVDALIERARREIRDANSALDLLAAAEGLTVRI